MCQAYPPPNQLLRSRHVILDGGGGPLQAVETGYVLGWSEAKGGEGAWGALFD